MSRREARRRRDIRSFQSGLVVVVLAVSLLAARAAHATEKFPSVIKSEWSVKSLPESPKGCKLCHSSDDGGEVTQLFGKTVRKYNAKKNSSASLIAALALVENNRTDSDKDGILDYQEIAKDTTNPNDPRDFVVPPPPPMGGQGGESNGGGDDAGEGGSSAAIGGGSPVILPPAEPLPPPFVHGCGTARHRHQSVPWLEGLLLAIFGWSRRRRARRG